MSLDKLFIKGYTIYLDGGGKPWRIVISKP